LRTTHASLVDDESKIVRSLKICFIGTPWLAVTPKRGGIPKTILELSRVLSRDHEVHILCPEPVSEEPEGDGGKLRFHYAPVREVVAYPIPEKVAMSVRGIGLFARMTFAIAAIFVAYAKVHRQYSFDVTLVTNKFVALPILGAFGRRHRGIFVYSEQNIWPWLYPVPRGSLDRLRYYTNVWLGKLTYSLSDAVHANSDSIRDALLRYGMASKPIAAIPNGVENKLIEVGPTSLLMPLRVAFVGRLVEDKGAQILVDVIRRMAASDSRVHFTIFGDGPFRRRLMEAKTENYTLLGNRPREEVLDALRSIQVILFLSAVENVPSLALLEALAMGKAVVATNVGDTPRFLSDGQNAVLCDPDAEAVEVAVLRIADDGNLYDRLTQGARALAAANSWEEMGRRHLTLYKVAIESAEA